MNQVILELLQQKKRTLITIVVLLLLNIGLYAVSTGYLDPGIVTARTSSNDLRDRVAVAGRTDVASIYHRGTEDLKKLAMRIPAKRQFPRVLGDILDTAASNAVITGTVSYKPEIVKGRDLLAYGISMTVSGSYAAVKSFLADVQNNGEMIVIDSMSLSNNDLYEENVVMDLRLTVYLQGKEGA
ncbi:MAG: type 4a pilus biogenesis protein PilO [Desulfuromonadales bacterium]|nr:type 4a pilus biogenesis protein PilO [Desulfuromonadales bacterium]